VEHVYATDLEDFGFYYLRIVWSGPEFDWGGFQFDGQVPFRPVQPVASSNHDLTSADIVDFWPAEVKYGLAWWADLPFNRIFEGSSGRSNASADAFLGDMDADMAVDAADIAMLMSHWNTSGPKGDLNEDGRVDAKDLMILLSNYGS
jgi:hypothetical protein